MRLTLSVHTSARAAHVRVANDLVYGCSDDLVGTVARLLTDRPGTRDLHLHFTDLAFCDSAGLSALLLVHRRSAIAGVRLHLDHRSAQLDRILDIAGLLEFLTARPSAVGTDHPPQPAGASSETEIG
ncbi:hypothetical protein Mycch_5179 [Mycolicibacterium chubuense NBB4]|uniref:STAS domain-containing protein n=1 Tax=Mycolicibacterium chubuense (strain NBB4) TaxID=710421 RepID=I4BRF8_MYCCN|nr:STAS domain-containing protein [Mycolicibacterium chubuense]AFM19865.1 hypothetical protein Mycch_5179 [Mycolicibacterium chubuense NBB4]